MIEIDLTKGLNILGLIADCNSLKFLILDINL